MSTSVSQQSSSGSRWHRWEPHVHAPGTILNDQFRGPNAWEDYLNRLETASPPIRALGITDYYSTDSYERVHAAKSAGRLADCDLIFPNIEMRLGIGTVRGAWVNIHLLVSPEHPDHIIELKRFLARLSFTAFDDTFCCSPDDLIKLGHRADGTIQDQVAALEHGSKQFKVSFDQLRYVYGVSGWAQANVLVAVAGSATDGTSGVRDSADTTLREELEKFAHIIFASSPSQREYWLGQRALGSEEIRNRYGSLKPCLHGSDAHDHESVGAPSLDRFCWIKGAPDFDALRQACIEPAGRAYIGADPPMGATPSQVIERVQISNAPWARTACLELNPGLVAVIGPRGSGKTALAEMIAAGCDALPELINEQSFLYRAHDYLGDAAVRLDWQAGGSETRPLSETDADFAHRYPRARYLSQQFVETLCASHGMTDALLHEIERVVFDAHDVTARDGAVDFDELLEMRATRHRQARAREEEALANLSDRIGVELEKIKLVAFYRAQVREKTQLIARHTADRAKLVAKGSEERVARLEALTKAAERIRSYVRYFNSQQQQLLLMQDEVADVRTNKAPETLREMQQHHASSGLKGDDWLPFLMDFKGDVDKVLKEKLAQARKNITAWKGSTPAPLDTPYIAGDADLEQQPLALLEAEIARLEKLVTTDRETVAKFSALSRRIIEESTALERLNEKLSDCEGARGRALDLVTEREASYVRVFEAVLAEQAVLSDLYAPIRYRLEAAEGALRKLSFSVTRVADVEGWAKKGEELFDLRVQGPFRGRGTLRQFGDVTLKQAWETGDTRAVASAMQAFREQHQDALLEHSPVPKTSQTEYRAWSRRFAQWLYSTDHIAVRYSVDYEGVDIRKLSPGTRGIVLLLLYLALDDADDRPLIIDQPEENLDPKSIFDELVGLFQLAKSKRQVIIVTHNANLVVNADADQIIVASAGPNLAGNLPPISYLSGGLESEHIRRAVCDTLEGGELAFKERARRLRVRLDR
jgi:energy-coupling factor transporter ATP-binding protein EcfA2